MKFIFSIFFLLAIFPISAIGQAGTIDSTFGYFGFTTAGPGFRDNYGTNLLIMANDDIWFSGNSWTSNTYTSLAIPKDAPSNYYNISVLGSPAMATQPDGKVLIGNKRYVMWSIPEWKVELDSTYGIDGFIAFPFTLRQIITRYDGKIFATGTVWPDFALTCRNEDGSVDSSFGIDGIVITDFGGLDVTNGLVIQPDGKILVSGTTYNNDSSNFFVVRYLSNGDFDSTFGINGKKQISFPEGSTSIASMALHLDGRIVIAGNLNNTTPDFVITTLQPNGNIDSSFGENGRVITDIDSSDETCKEQSMVIDNFGRIVMVGNTEKKEVWTKQMSLARYNSDGNFDESFGHGGKIQHLGLDASGVSLESTGKIIVVGTKAGPMGYTVMFVARYKATGGALPLNINSFSVLKMETSVRLDWKAGADILASNFVIERSADGKLFSYIGEVKANKGENLANYTFEDKQPLSGKNFYRIKQLSENGVPEYSSTLFVEFFPTSKIKLAPNPVFNSLQLEGLWEGKNNLSILDASGKLIKRIQTETKSFSWDVQNLSSGLYYLKIENGNLQVNIKFIKN